MQSLDLVKAFIAANPDFPAALNGILPKGKSVSCLGAAYRDARLASGRNINSGEIENPKISGNWAGALTYLIIADQVGTCFKRAGIDVGKDNELAVGLKHFSDASQDEVDALYALRCAFAHGYCLQNVFKKKNGSIVTGPLTRRFFLLNSGNPSLMTPPKRDWNGLPDDLGDDTVTVVDFEKLGTLVEKMRQNLLHAADDGHLEVRLADTLEDGLKQLLAKYTFMVT